MNIDWALLREQKSALVRLAMSNRLNPSERAALDGIVNLIDGIQDEAVRSKGADEVAVFGEKVNE